MSNYAIFPFGQVDRNARILIYGAGVAGKNMYMQVKKTEYCTVLGMVDKSYKEKNLYEIEVFAPEYLREYDDYDYIVVSIMNEKIKNHVHEQLLNEYRVPRNKVIVPRNNIINWEYCFWEREDEIKYADQFPEYIKRASPKELISSKRIDVSIRYLLFRDFINRYENKDNLSLFKRYTLLRTGGVEIETVHSPIGKSTIDEYIESGKELCKSMQENGFIKEGLIPVNEKNEPLDGLHRIAAAIVLEKDVMTHKFEGLEQRHVDFSFFNQAGFTSEDKVRILRGFTEIYGGECGCMVLFYPCHKLWEYIEGQLSVEFNVVGAIDYDFENNYIGFENIVREIYYDSQFKNEMIQRKINVLKYERLIIRFILINDENRKRKDFYGDLKAFKLDIRNRLFDDFEEVPIVAHSPDTKEEFRHLRNIFLSVNNIKWMKRKTCQFYRSKFIDMIYELDRWCLENEVKKDEIAIVSSASMEVFGLKECGDIDFIILPHYRNRFNGDESYTVSANLEIVHRNYAWTEKTGLIADETVIWDDSLHFYFCGFKFINLELVKEKKMLQKREKDLKDIRSIELFFNWDQVFDDKEALRHRIQEEMLRRKY